MAFAIAMSADGLFGGLGAALMGLDLWKATALNFVCGVIAVQLGSFMGRTAAKKMERDFSWIGGVLFVVLAFTKVV